MFDIIDIKTKKIGKKKSDKKESEFLRYIKIFVNVIQNIVKKERPKTPIKDAILINLSSKIHM